MRKKTVIRKTSIKTRLIVTFALSCIIPIILIYVVSMRLFSNSLERYMSASVEQTLSLINTNMVTELAKYQYLSGVISINESLKEGLVNDSITQQEKHNLRLEMRTLIQNQIIYPAQAKNITVCDTDGEVFYSMGYDGFYDADLLMLIADTEQAAPMDSWNYVQTYRGRKTIVLGRKIRKNYTSEKHIGYVFISIDEKVFSKTVLAPVNLGDGHNFMYMNADGTVLSSADGEVELGKPYKNEALIERILAEIPNQSGSFVAQTGETNELVSYIYNEQLNQFFVSTIPISYLNATINQLWFNIGLILLILLLLITMGVMLIYRSIARPIQNMIEFCCRIAEGDFNARIQDEARDELASLSGSMNSMALNIRELMATQKETEQEKRKVEIQMLQYQISPHFLFNTLNSLRFVASMNNDPVVSDGIHALSLLLQNTISNMNEYIKIREEIENLSNYFSIQDIRYAGEFEVRYEIEEELLDFYCPKFILQPLAENSVVHGASSKLSITNIVVKCYREGETIILTIFDDGKGFEMTEGKLPQSNGTSIGIRNVNNRIQLHFGEAYGVEIKSTVNQGTINIIRIPVMAAGDERLNGIQGEEHV